MRGQFWQCHYFSDKNAKRTINPTCRGCQQRQRGGLDPKVRERPLRDKLQYGNSSVDCDCTGGEKKTTAEHIF